MRLSKVTYIALKVYILSVHAISGNRTHDIDIALTYFVPNYCKVNNLRQQKIYIYAFAVIVHAFTGNRTYDLGVA